MGRSSVSAEPYPNVQFGSAQQDVTVCLISSLRRFSVKAYQ